MNCDPEGIYRIDAKVKELIDDPHLHNWLGCCQRLAFAECHAEYCERRDLVSIHHGGGVGMGFSQHSGRFICCDGTEDKDRRLANVLWNVPAIGVMRHAEIGYTMALDCACEQGLELPGISGNPG